MDKRDRAILFRSRLADAMRASGETRSGLARKVGVDRSTVSQLLSEDSARLPNAQVVAECASALGVAGDWLLGLSDLPERASEILDASVQVSRAERAPVDRQFLEWLREAAGYKIRHVPATLPDILKTEALLRWEYSPNLGRTTEQAIGATRDRLDWMRNTMSDYEIAVPLFMIESFASSTGYYRDLPEDVRSEQIAHMIALHEEFYPSFRIFIFDARQLWSAALTVFGPLMAVIYLGRNYLAFRDRKRVHTLAEHFDWLVREAYVPDRDWPAYLQRVSGR